MKTIKVSHFKIKSIWHITPLRERTLLFNQNPEPVIVYFKYVEKCKCVFCTLYNEFNVIYVLYTYVNLGTVSK